MRSHFYWRWSPHKATYTKSSPIGIHEVLGAQAFRLCKTTGDLWRLGEAVGDGALYETVTGSAIKRRNIERDEDEEPLLAEDPEEPHHRRRVADPEQPNFPCRSKEADEGICHGSAAKHLAISA